MLLQAKSHKRGCSGGIPDAISIRERPAEIEDRAVPGHWEGDLVVGSSNSAIATVVERRSRFTVLCKVDSKHAAIVLQALAMQMKKLPDQVLKSLT